MSDRFEITGHMIDGQTVALDRPIPISGDVNIVVVPRQTTEPSESLAEFLDRIHADQKARGHVPPTREEVERYIEEERNSWDRS